MYELAQSTGCTVTHWEPTAAAAAADGDYGRLEFDIQDALVR